MLYKFYVKNLIFSFLISFLSFQANFCMHNYNNIDKNIERPAKRQKIYNSLIIAKNLQEDLLDKKLATLEFQDIKNLADIEKFSGYLVAYQSSFSEDSSIESCFNNGIKYAFISEKQMSCNKCVLPGFDIKFLRKKGNKIAKFVFCNGKVNTGSAFVSTHNQLKVRLLTLQEIQNILTLANSEKYLLANLYGQNTKVTLSNLKLTNLLPEEKRKYLYAKLPSVRLILIAYKKEDNNTECFLNRVPKDVIKIIIKFLVYDSENNNLKLEL